MDWKKFIKDALTIYFTLVTLITLATLILGLCFKPKSSFGYEAFATPLIYGACGLIPMMIMYTDRELTLKERIVRKLIQLVLVEIIILFIAFYPIENTEKRIEDIVIMGISILVIYILVHIVDWIQNYMSAKKMTEQLIKLQGNQKEK